MRGSVSLFILLVVAGTSWTKSWNHKIVLRSWLDDVIDNTFEKHTEKQVTCGRSAYQNLTSRVVGGEEAVPYSSPWMASMRVNGRHICGGSILTKDWIITAAHCSVESHSSSKRSFLRHFFNLKTRGDSWHVRDHTKITIVAGEFDRSVQEGPEQERSVAEIIVHSDYNSQTHDKDLALLRLETPLDFSEEISPVCLPDADVLPTDTCKATGWGETQDRTETNNILREASLPILDQNLCMEDIGSALITENMLCAGYQEGGIDTCQGDSGGPLVCQRSGCWVLAGLTSFGNGCAEPQNPGVYTRVANFQDWIREHVGDDIQFL